MYTGEQVLAFYEEHKKEGVTLAECIDEALNLAKNQVLKQEVLLGVKRKVKEMKPLGLRYTATSIVETIPLNHQKPFVFWVVENRYENKPNRQLNEESYTNWLVHTGLH